MSSLNPQNTSSIFSFLSKNIEKEFNRNGKSFSQELFACIDAKKISDVEVYTRARIDRKLFSKIRKRGYLPSKKTIIALALALEMEYSETINLLGLAGFTLSTSPSMPFDIIISNAIQNRLYDIERINEILYKYHLPLLGG